MRINIPITAAEGGGLGLVTIGPGSMGVTNDTAHVMANTVDGDVSTKYTTVMLSKLECTDAAHSLWSLLREVVYLWVVTPYKEGIGKSSMVDRIISLRDTIVDGMWRFLKSSNYC